MDSHLRGIHIFNDDKFIDTTIEIFETFKPNLNEYFVIVKSEDRRFKYVKSSLAKPVYLKKDGDYKDFLRYIEEKNPQVIYLHALNAAKRNITRMLSGKQVLVWFVWGYDFYNAWPVTNQKIYLPKTKRFLLKNKEFNKNYKDSIWNSYFGYNLFRKLSKWPVGYRPMFIYPHLSKSFRAYYNAVKKIDIVIPVLESELPIIERMKISFKSASFSYGYLEQLLGPDYRSLENNTGENILVGNSAAFANNHIEAFEILSKLNLNNRKVYVPLSYGSTKEYVDFVVLNGKRLLGDNFFPLLDFITLEEYNVILKSCGILFFNHRRQQGVGNIVSLGYLGAKIYLNKNNAVYTYLKKSGAHVFSIDILTQEILGQRLTSSQIIDNRLVLEKKYTFQNALNQVKDMERVIIDLLNDKIR